MKRFFIGVAVGAVMVSVAVWQRESTGAGSQIKVVSDTVRVTDTLVVARHEAASRVVVRNVVREMPLVADSLCDADTVVSVAVPVESAVYETADYRAVVSGFDVSLDTLELRREMIRVTNRIVDTPERAGRWRRWGVSVTAGVAVTPRGVQPMVGVGVSYRLLSF